MSLTISALIANFKQQIIFMVVHILRLIKDITEVIIEWILFFINSIHKWMRKEPPEPERINKISKLNVSISLIVFGLLIAPQANSYFAFILNIDEKGAASILAILILLFYIIIHCSIGIINSLRGKKINISTKYKLAFSILSIPAPIILCKYFIPLIKPLAKKYEQQITRSR